MAGFALRVKTKNGQIVLNTVQPSSTIYTLKEELSNITKISPNNLHVLYGFPPKPLDLSIEDKTLESRNIHSGDTLIIEEKPSQSIPTTANPIDENQPSNEVRRHITENSVGLESPGILLKKVVPADNSCLFTSIGFVLGGKVDVTCGTYMRQIIAEAVAGDADCYNEAILGRPNDDYCKWIQRPESWGGAIELAILSKFYGMEIAVVDTINAIINKFGEDQMYDHRVFLIFDGIHYDPLYLEPFQDNGSIQTVFPRTDDKILREAETLAMEAQTSRQFTDVNKFSLRCLDCGVYLKGQTEAVGHAKDTGHSNFGEVNS